MTWKLGSERLMPLSLRSWILILGMSGLIVLFWFAGGGVALRYLVGIGFTGLSFDVLTLPSSGTLYWGHVMFVLCMGYNRLVGMGMNISSRTYSKSLVLDDTVVRKVENSDASAFARICGCCPSQGKVQILIQFAFSKY